jgi:predicted ATPase
LKLLLSHATRPALSWWHAYGRKLQGLLLIKRSDIDAEVRVVRPALDELREARFAFHHTAFLTMLAEALGSAGRVAEGQLAIDEAIGRSERTEERWSMAELLRVKGELRLLHGEPNLAEEHWLQTLDWARRQELLSWELRGATSLARLWHKQDRTLQARELLAFIYDRFTEGFGTADLIAAKAVLQALPRADRTRRRRADDVQGR